VCYLLNMFVFLLDQVCNLYAAKVNIVFILMQRERKFVMTVCFCAFPQNVEHWLHFSVISPKDVIS